jgi:hypothetical protein
MPTSTVCRLDPGTARIGLARNKNNVGDCLGLPGAIVIV